MQLDLQRRTPPTARPESRVFAITTVIAILVAGLAVVAIPELRYLARAPRPFRREPRRRRRARRRFRRGLQAVGFAPLPASVAASDKRIPAANLAVLAREPCDGKAIAALGEALVKERAERSAAEALLGFAEASPMATARGFAPRKFCARSAITRKS